MFHLAMDALTLNDDFIRELIDIMCVGIKRILPENFMDPHTPMLFYTHGRDLSEIELLKMLKKYFQLELGENEEAQRWFENWNRVRVVYKSNYQTYIDSVNRSGFGALASPQISLSCISCIQVIVYIIQRKSKLSK